MRYMKLTVVLAAWAMLAAGCSQGSVTERMPGETTPAETEMTTEAMAEETAPETTEAAPETTEETAPETTEAADETDPESDPEPVPLWQHAYGEILAEREDRECALIFLDEDEFPELVVGNEEELSHLDLYGFDGKEAYLIDNVERGHYSLDIRYRLGMRMICSDQGSVMSEGTYWDVIVYDKVDGRLVPKENLVTSDYAYLQPEEVSFRIMNEKEEREVYALSDDRRDKVWEYVLTNEDLLVSEGTVENWIEAPVETEADAPYAVAYRELLESRNYVVDGQWRDLSEDHAAYLYAMPGRTTPLLIVKGGGRNDVLFYAYDEEKDSAVLRERIRTENYADTFLFRPETGDIGEECGRIAGGGEYAIRCKNLDEDVWYAFPPNNYLLEGEAADEATVEAFDIQGADTFMPMFGESWTRVGEEYAVPIKDIPYITPFS